MARADLLLNLVKAGASGERELLVRTTQALIAEEHEKQHHVLANSLDAQLRSMQKGMATMSLQGPHGHSLVHERAPERKLTELFLSPGVRSAVSDLVEEQQRADLLRSYNLEPRHRVLLTGSPGNGKTSLAEALAESLGATLFSVRYDALIGSFLGETASRVRQLFDFVCNRRCVLFFDEFDTVAKERGDTHETGEIKRVVSSLLLEIDRLPSYVLVVTATNHPELLDRAVWRRFQLKIELPKPTLDQINDWLGTLEQRLEAKIARDSKTLAKRLRGLSFSELEDMTQDILRKRALSAPCENAKIADSVIRLWTKAAHRERLAIDGYAAPSDFSNLRARQTLNARLTSGSHSLSSSDKARRENRSATARTGANVRSGKRGGSTSSRRSRTRTRPRS
jgi:SpoVK/Ycf46/Vps4 family AAA+-type ATPase